MKANIHPNYKKVTVKFPKGDSFETYSAINANEIFVDVDFRNHPAWTKKGAAEANASNAKVTEFNRKFGGLDFFSSAKKN
jgi:large subunit ribosomal protein L31